MIEVIDGVHIVDLVDKKTNESFTDILIRSQMVVAGKYPVTKDPVAKDLAAKDAPTLTPVDKRLSSVHQSRQLACTGSLQLFIAAYKHALRCVLF